MKFGKTLNELAAEIMRQAATRQDVRLDTRHMHLDGFYPEQPVRLRCADEDSGIDMAFGVNEIAHRQIGTHCGIPAKYYDRMQAGSPALLAMNVNHWFRAEPSRRMVRTLDGTARAFLSDRYHRIDNDHIAAVALPVIQELEGVYVESCEITERRLYIKIVNERVQGEVEVGDVVQAGLCLTNSEVGMGALAVSPLAFRLICKNGMVMQDSRFRRAHIGARADATEQGVFEMLSDEALAADDNAILLKVRDVMAGAMQQAFFDKQIEKMRAAKGGDRIESPAAAIEVLAKRERISEAEKPDILRHLAEGGDLSKWGLLNAVTRAAQDVASYDRSTELEEIGGKILELNNSEWREMALAA